MIGLLIWLLVFLVVIYVAREVINSLGLPDNIRNVVFLILGLIALLVLLGQLGVIGGAAYYPLRI